MEFECPRCGSGVSEAYFGPCASCRGTLRQALARQAVDVQADEYEPKMNVTPNAVALRDD